MRVGVAIEDTWDFFHEIYADLQAHHTTSLFERPRLHLPVLNGRLSHALFRRSLHGFARNHDVIFFEWAGALLAAATQLPKQCGIVTRLHRFELYQWADAVNWDAVDHIVLVSKAKQAEFAARFPAQAGKITVIPEAVSLRRFTFQERPFNGDLGILCHMRPRKRVYELILAFYELLQDEPHLHLHIGGGKVAGLDEYTTALERLVARLGIQSKVTFYGHVERPEQWFKGIDVLISNSYSEGLQVSPLEAMASGCYCLSHRWEGAEEIFPEEALYFTDSELRRKVLAYCALPEAERSGLRHAARARVEAHCDVDKTKVQIRGLVEAAGGQAR
jgi:glycosyltransferase involved in cell wall biosynthesis